MRVTSTLLAASLLSLPCAARAQDANNPASPDPFRPVQPAWPEGWSAETPAPDAAPAQQAQPATNENEELTFDQETQNPAPAGENPEAKSAERAEPADPATLPNPITTAVAPPPPEVDLHTPHVWMATGGIVIGVSVVAALAAAIALDQPGLAGATLGIGGCLGVAGLTVGVVMQNGRLEAAGHEVTPALPTGIGLKLALTR